MAVVSVRRFALIGLGALLALYFGNAIFPLVSYKGVLYWIALVFLIFAAADHRRVLALVTEPSTRPFIYLPAALFLLSLLPLDTVQPGIKSQQMLVFSVIVLIGCLLVLTEVPRDYSRRLQFLLIAVLLLGIGLNFYTCLQHDTVGVYYSNSYGNSHYIAQLCLLTLLLFCYFLTRSGVIWMRLVLVVGMLASGWVLIVSLSRPAWLALIVTAVGVMALFCRPRQQLLWLAGLLFLLGALYALLPDQFARRIDDLVLNFGSEERVKIWSDGVRMQLASAPVNWVIGHGPGSYAQTFKDFYIADEQFYFPHNFVLELLFESGLIGLILVILFYVLLYRLIVTLRRRPAWRAEAQLLFSCISVNLLFAFLTVPFYSRYLLLIQAPFIALAIHWQRQRDDIGSGVSHGLDSAIVSASASAVSMTETEKAAS